MDRSGSFHRLHGNYAVLEDVHNPLIVRNYIDKVEAAFHKAKVVGVQYGRSDSLSLRIWHRDTFHTVPCDTVPDNDDQGCRISAGDRRRACRCALLRIPHQDGDDVQSQSVGASGVEIAARPLSARRSNTALRIRGAHSSEIFGISSCSVVALQHLDDRPW
jgi:hypothetical protein